MISNKKTLGQDIVESIGEDLLEEFAAFVASAIENGIDKSHDHFSILQRLTSDLSNQDLEVILEATEIEMVRIDCQHQEEALKRRKNIIKLLDISEAKFDAIKLDIKNNILEGKEPLNSIKFRLSDDNFKQIVSYVKKELADQISASSKQLRPKSYEGIGLSGKFNERGFEIKEVFLGSDAHEKGIKSGDVIVAVLEHGKARSVSDQGLTDQDKVNLIRGNGAAQEYQILQDGDLKIVKIERQRQNSVYKASETMSTRIKYELAQRMVIPKAPKMMIPMRAPIAHGKSLSL